MDQDASCSGSHLSVEEIAVYVDLLTTRPGRLRVETHLVHCDVCLADVVAATVLTIERVAQRIST